jgi:alpha-N-arabinofuranosidase
MRTLHFAVLALILSMAAQGRADDPPSGASGPIQVTIDATKPGAPINPFIYGQFIEHLGRCIYGGIWAEMLEDRKFYFPITDDYNPYRSLTDTEFPVVGASPWEVLGPKGSVTMVKEDPFAGEHTPRIAAGSGIRQNDLGLVAGKKYVGYVRFLMPEGDAKVQIRLGVKDNYEVKLSGVSTQEQSDQYKRVPFVFTAMETSNKGWLAINVEDTPVMIGAVSLMPADNVRGMRADTLDLLKQLNASMYRWPGGNFVSGYDWRDGIGPRDRRPPRRNPAWTGVEHNDFGIDEFIDFCREVGAEPMIAANTGFGDDYSAAQEVEYTNGSAETIGGQWRTKNGHPDPYRVKYWCVGNEMWGDWQLGHMQLGQYTQKHNLVAKAMHKVDPSLVLVASGDLGTQGSLGDDKHPGNIGWSQGMLERCADHMDLISEHFYCGRLPWTKDGEIPIDKHVGLIREEIRKKANSHRELQPKLGRTPENFIPIAMDEWNYWHRDYVYGELGCQYNLADALGIAAGLHEYFRNSDMIHMAHYAQTVNVIGCVKTTKTGAFLDSTALPLLLYRREFGKVPLAVSGNHSEALLDIAAATTEDGRALTIGIVNSRAKPQMLQITVDGLKPGTNAKVWRIAGNDPALFNTVDKKRIAIADEQQIPFNGELTVPAYSVNLYRVPIE